MHARTVIRTLTLSSAALFAFAALPATACAGKDSAHAQPVSQTATATQRDKDFEHELVQTDGANHPREAVKTGKVKSKPSVPAKKAQRDLDFEHELVQTDGVVHPRQKTGDNVKQPVKRKASAKTQRELDHEHDQLQSDGVDHPRQMIAK